MLDQAEFSMTFAVLLKAFIMIMRASQAKGGGRREEGEVAQPTLGVHGL